MITYMLMVEVNVVEQENETEEDRLARVQGVLEELMTHGINIMGEKMMRHGVRLEPTGKVLSNYTIKNKEE